MTRRAKVAEVLTLIRDDLRELVRVIVGRDADLFERDDPILIAIPPILLRSNVTSDARSLYIQLEIVKERLRRMRTR